MDIVSLCPFEAGAFLWEAAQGQHSLTVVVKGTFALVPGELVLADTQDPLCEERHLEDSALASLYWSGDYAPVKRKVDLTLVGSAYAPGGYSATSLVARLAVGDFVKSVRVTGDRAWTPDGADLVPGPPAPFTRLPLRYERAALSNDNPVGFDPNGRRAAGAAAAPNLERVDGAGVPCFGPVAPSWRGRRKLLDESAMFWAYGVVRAPYVGGPSLGPAPARFDFAFFNSAPADQQLDLLRPGTPIVLDHLHPQRARLETRVGPMRPQVFRVPPADVLKGRVDEIILRCDSLWIDSDRSVVVLTWRGVADAPGGEARVGTLVVDADPQGKKLRWDRVEARFSEVHVPTQRLPGADAPQTPRVSAPLHDPLAMRYDGRRAADGAPASAPRIAAPETIGDEPTNPLEPPSDRAPTAMFKQHRMAPGRPRPEIPSVRTGATLELGEPKQPARPVVVPGPPPPVARSAPGIPAPRIPGPSKPMMMLGAAPPPASAPMSAPPPVTEAPRKLGAPKAPKPGARDAGPALRKDLTIDRYAAIVAELGRAGTVRGVTLKAHLLTEPGWIMVDQHWKKALAREAEEGGRELLLAFDEGFLAAQARLGKPIGLPEYARIQVGLECGQVGRVLGELELELSDLMRLQRVWTKRLADSAELVAELARAVEDARKTMG